MSQTTKTVAVIRSSSLIGHCNFKLEMSADTMMVLTSLLHLNINITVQKYNAKFVIFTDQYVSTHMLFEKRNIYLLRIESSHTNPKSGQSVPGLKQWNAKGGMTILNGEKEKENN